METEGITAFTVRAATAADQCAITTLLQTCYPVLMPAGYDPDTLAPALPFITQANPRLLASGNFYIAEGAGGVAVGCGGWSLERPATDILEEQLAHIRHFATHPGWTGRGVGRAIYDRCERQARAAGARCFECYASLNAESFYAALGFVRLDSMTVDLPNGAVFPAIRMRRPI